MRGIGSAIESAKKYDIPLIISGTGARVAYLAMIPELYQGGDPRFFKNVLKGSELVTSVDQLSGSDSLYNFEKLMGIALRTLGLPIKTKHQQIGIYDYFEPDLINVYEIIQKEMGWTKPDGNAEHMDCLVQSVANYIQTLKFPELTHKTIYNSGQVRFGRMSREAALEVENDNLHNTDTPAMLDTFLREINMDKKVFYNSTNDWRKLDSYRNKELDSIRRIYRKIARN
ncbi:MAG: hypothetical protein WBN77_04810 [Desulfobacterales bacterium]